MSPNLVGFIFRSGTNLIPVRCGERSLKRQDCGQSQTALYSRNDFWLIETGCFKHDVGSPTLDFLPHNKIWTKNDLLKNKIFSVWWAAFQLNGSTQLLCLIETGPLSAERTHHVGAPSVNCWIYCYDQCFLLNALALNYSPEARSKKWKSSRTRRRSKTKRAFVYLSYDDPSFLSI